jgi:glycosyltransferase involved in cell wall biosynthesis
MNFCIITHVAHSQINGNYFAYAPYVNEMNIWLQYCDEVTILAPLVTNSLETLGQNYMHEKLNFIKVHSFSFVTIKKSLKAIFLLPKICIAIFRAMKKADHIHLRCPGNMGLLGCVIQIFFPNKIKTAKYAGNWDPKAKQPLSYKLQKWILRNTFLTKNIQVLVYGEWKNQSKNIKSFFTATYFESEKTVVEDKSLNDVIQFIFVGTLSAGKQPLYAIQIVEKMRESGFKVQLELYGEGQEKSNLKNYIEQNSLSQFIFLKGNKNRDELIEVYKKSHFVLLPSKSEGWPKAVAEAMFWKCLPLANPVSCLPTMLDNENRGLFLELDLEKDIKQITSLLEDKSIFKKMSNRASDWSRLYTIQAFEKEIEKLLLIVRKDS